MTIFVTRYGYGYALCIFDRFMNSTRTTYKTHSMFVRCVSRYLNEFFCELTNGGGISIKKTISTFIGFDKKSTLIGTLAHLQKMYELY